MSTLTELLAEYRSDLADNDTPYLWPDTDLVIYINRAIDIMCEKAYLIADSSTALYCVQNLMLGTQAYQKHPKVIQVRWARLDGMTIPVERKTLNWLESHFPSWQTVTPAFPRYFCEDIDKGYITYIPSPDTTYVSRLLVYRYSVAPMTLSAPNAEPEIEVRYHKYLKYGIFWQAFMKDDPEAYDPKRASEYKMQFDKDVARQALEIQKTWYSSTTVGVHKGFT